MTQLQAIRSIDVAKLTPVFERARRALLEAITVDEVKTIRDQAQAIQAYLHQQRASLEMQNNAAEINLRAQKRLGEMTTEMEKNRGAATPLHDVTALPPTYEDLGIARMTAHRWQQIASLPEDTFERLIQERKENGEELTSAYILRSAQANAKASKTRSPLPPGRFDVIYADPPWPYDNQIESWGPTSLHYSTLDITELKVMEVAARTADDATLFLWVTNPFLEDALAVATSWGFEYKTNVVWVKTNLQRPGAGFYVRGRHELLFICTKGSHVPDQRGHTPIGSVLFADVQEHSRKPVEVYELIERIYPRAKRLELFARGPTRTEWTAWGDEANG